MKFYRTGRGIVLSPENCDYGFRITNEARIVHADMIDINKLLDEGGLKEASESELKNELVVKTNSMYVYLNKAEALARERHAGQTDKAGNDYYESHIRKVADLTCTLFEGGYAQIVALLHDILEDTSTTERELFDYFPEEVVEAVKCLTRVRGETYREYIARVKKNPLAVKVKICDLANNMDLSRIKNPTEEDRKRNAKYANAFAELLR